MGQQIINNGDTGLVVRTKINENFAELYVLPAKVATLEAGAINSDAAILALQNDVNALDVRLTQAEGDIVALDARVTASEADISALQPVVAQHTADIADIYATAVFTDQLYADPAWLTSLASNKLVGQIPIALIPPSAMERIFVWATPPITDPWAIGLTQAQVQNGDSVLMKTDNDKMYVVVDDTQLNSPLGFQVYTAGAAASVPFTGITGLPTTLAGYGITDAWKTSGVTPIASATIQGGAPKTDNLNFDRLNIFSLSDSKVFSALMDTSFSYSLVGAETRNVKLDATEFEVTFQTGVNTSKITVVGGLITHDSLSHTFNNKVHLSTVPVAGNALTDLLVRDPSGEIKFKTVASMVNGTINRIPKFTSANVIGNSQIFDDGTNVGIGTVTPQAKFDVEVGSAVDSLSSYFTRGNSDAGFRIGFRNGSGAVINSEQGALVFDYVGAGTLAKIGFWRGGASDTLGINFWVNGAERMMIRETGNVGIGTVSPSEKLHVKGKFILHDDTGVAGSAVELRVSNSNPWLIRGFNDTYNPANATFFLGLENDGKVTVSVPISLSLMGGNVGIGTNAPSMKLHVETATGNQGLFRSTDPATYGGVRVANDLGNFVEVVMYGSGIGQKGYIGTRQAINFSINTNDTERITVLSGGNVGIGTATPDMVLHVSSGEQNLAKFQGTSGAYVYLTSGNGFNSEVVFQSNALNKWSCGFDTVTAGFRIFDQANGVQRLTVWNNGAVSIGGTVLPTGVRLLVQGGHLQQIGTAGDNTGIILRAVVTEEPEIRWIGSDDNARFTAKFLGFGTGTERLSFQKHSFGTNETFIIYVNGSIGLPTLPASAAGLPAGSVWRNGTVLNIV